MNDGITRGEVMVGVVGEALKVKATVDGVARRRPQCEPVIGLAAPCAGWLLGWRRS